jgi:dihydrolipoamide dehydrogenase
MDRVKRERDRFVGFVVESVDDIPEEEKLIGFARFVDGHTLQVDDHTRVTARGIVLATGSSPWIPPSLKALGDRVIVNDDVFDFDDLPRSIAVVGMGVIGLELGQALHRLGVETVCVTPSERVGPLSDPEIQTKALEIFGDELNLHTRITDLEAKRDGDAVALSWTDADGTEQSARVEKVLASAGRRPNLARLELDKAGIEPDEKGMPKSDARTGQIGESHIFIAGDVSGYRPLLHEAADGGRFAGENAARFPDVRAHVRRAALSIVFSDPNIAVAGCSYRELALSDITIGEVSYEDQGRSRVMGKNRGHVRIYARTTCGTLLGAEMLGPRVEHTSHLLSWAMQQNLTVDDVLTMPFYHPVVEEGIRTALRDLAAKLKLAPRPPSHELDCGPGVR